MHLADRSHPNAAPDAEPRLDGGVGDARRAWPVDPGPGYQTSIASAISPPRSLCVAVSVIRDGTILSPL